MRYFNDVILDEWQTETGSLWYSTAPVLSFSDDKVSPIAVFAPPPTGWTPFANVNGDNGDNVLDGTPGDDIINGFGGNDTITTLTGNDTVNAGDGDDVIILSTTSTGSVNGGTGFDTVRIVADSFFALPSYTNNDMMFLSTNGGTLTLLSIERYEVVGETSGDIERLLLVTGTGDDVVDLTTETLAPTVDIWVNTGDGMDVITVGDTPNITINGGAGDDVITAGAFGGTYEGGAGADVITGGAGVDRLSYLDSNAGVTVNLDTGAASRGYAAGDTFSNIENLLGSIHDDVLTGDNGANTLWGYAGPDTLTGLGGSDTFIVAAGPDFFSATITDLATDDFILMYSAVFIGQNVFSNVAREVRYEKVGGQTLLHLDLDGDGVTDETSVISNGEFDLTVASNISNRLTLKIAPPSIDGTPGDDMLVGTTGDDVINGFGGNDTITTFTGNDTVNAGDGDDTIIMSDSSSGTIDGGNGYDVISISSPFNNTAWYNANAGSLVFTVFLNGQTLSMTGVERFELSQESTGDYMNIYQAGTLGDDVIDLSGESMASFGSTAVFGFSGNDTIIGTTGADDFYGGDGADTLSGGLGADRFFGDAGADIINGGSNIGLFGGDSLEFSGSAIGVTVNLALGTGVGGDADGDSYTGIEHVSGSNGDDILIGDDADNRLTSNGGSDTLDGGDGNDILTFNTLGVTTMTGGTGADIFSTGSVVTIGGHTITDFEVGDIIALRNSFAENGFVELTLIGDAAFTGVIGEVRYEKVGGQTLVHVDTDGDAAADETLTISNGEFDLIENQTIWGDLTFSIDTTIEGTPDDDVMLGTVGDDVINSLGGNDTITTLTGNDIINAGDGDDTIIVSENGTGELDGGAGYDVVRIDSTFANFAWNGNSAVPAVWLSNSAGQYSLTAIEQVDVYAVDGTTLLRQAHIGTDGIDSFDLSAADSIGSRLIVTGDGNDTIINGAAAYSNLYSGAGEDTITGGIGTELINGGDGIDTLTGGGGEDTFFFQNYGSGFSDEITDFSGGDRITIFQGLMNGNYSVPTYIGTADFNSVAGEMRYEKVSGQSHIQLDIDGDGLADETLTVSSGEFDFDVLSSDSFSFSLGIEETTPGNDIVIRNGTDASRMFDAEGGYDVFRLVSDDVFLTSDGPGTGYTGIFAVGGSSFSLQNFERIEAVNTGDGLARVVGLNGTNDNEVFDLTAETSVQYGFVAAMGGDDIIVLNSGVQDGAYGGDGNDHITLGDGDGFAYGDAGNDTLIGGAGSDYLDGGDGDDAVYMDSADIFSNIVGGAGTDTLYFQSADGVHFDYGVQGFERGIMSTTSGDLWKVLTIFPDSNTRETVYDFDGTQLWSFTLTDTDVTNVQAWTSRTQFRNDANQNYEIHFTNDDGTSRQIRYDVDNNDGYTTLTLDFNASGQLDTVTNDMDNGRRVTSDYDPDGEELYALSILTEDLANEGVWDSVLDLRNDAGQRYFLQNDYDNGLRVEIEYDVENDDAYDRLVINTDTSANGSLLNYQTATFYQTDAIETYQLDVLADDDVRIITDFDLDGTQSWASQRLRSDTGDNYSWDTILEQYDAARQLQFVAQTNDGSYDTSDEFDLLGNEAWAQRKIYTDDEDQYSWTTITFLYDDAGNIYDTDYVYDA